jgi:uncharacterized protein YprB with RNaseH-like and TPR domain
MAKLVFDIETIGEDFQNLDKITQEVLLHRVKKEAKNKQELEIMLKRLKNSLGLSPLTGQVVAIGVLDLEQDKGVVYFQAPNSKQKKFSKNNFCFKPLSEKSMLENFWAGAKQYQEFISYNGRSFDVPFLIARSAVKKVKITKNLMSNRYINSQRFDAIHLDLLDQLTYYGATVRESLHLWCRALGIKSPKENGLDGEKINQYFQEGKYKEIACYNANDLIATKELYEIWLKYMRV